MSSSSSPSSNVTVIRHSVEEVTNVRFTVEASVPTAAGKLGCFCFRKVRKHDPVVLTRTGSFTVTPPNSEAEEHKRTAEFVTEAIKLRVLNDQEKFELVCKAIKLDPKNAHLITVKQIHKLRFLLGE